MRSIQNDENCEEKAETIAGKGENIFKSCHPPDC